MPVSYNVPPTLHAAMVKAEPQGNLTGASVHEQLMEVQSKAQIDNLLINSSFDINQDGVSGTVVLSAWQYGHDQWRAGSSGCTYTFATVENVTTLTISTGSLIQPIEGVALTSGTHILSWQGTCQGKIGTGSYGVSGITGWGTGGNGINIEFSTGTLSRPKFQAGSVATPWVREDPSINWARCLRFYEYIPSFRIDGVFSGDQYFYLGFTVRKRTTPSINFSYITLSYATNLRANVITTSGFQLGWDFTNVGYDGIVICTIAVNARL